MALSEFEIKRVEKLVGTFVENRRPEPHIREQLDLGYRITRQSFEIFEIRPRWDNPSEKLEGSIAKVTYVKSRKVWKLYWMRADLKWYSYTPFAESKSLEEVLGAMCSDWLEFGV